MNDAQPTVPYGYCHCGCGEKTNLAAHSDVSHGLIGGEPRAFVAGHQRRSLLPSPNPSGLCRCGCGQTTPIAKRTRNDVGHVRGHHTRFVHSHVPPTPKLPPPNPSGLCLCGCGEITSRARQTTSSLGHVEGEHVFFLAGHQTRTPGIPLCGYLVEDHGFTTACHVWKLDCDANGYGRVGRHELAHRRAWIDANGQPPPETPWVLHHCDNPPCCNVEHLFLGDSAANSADCVAKGRHAYGERNGHAKLTAEQVRVIRASLASGTTSRELAASFGVAQATIASIAVGKNWAWLL